MARLATAQRAPAKPAGTRLAQPPSRIHDSASWASTKPRLSLILPFRKQDPLGLLLALNQLPNTAQVEVVIYDDAACDRELTASLVALTRDTGLAIRMITASIPIGTSRARNLLLEPCRGEWILMLEAETAPADAGFLRRYEGFLATNPPPGLVIGGFAPSPTPRNLRCGLHHRHSAQFECLPAAERRRRPIRHLHVGNALFHKQIFSTCRFDELFRGRGWEGVDWGLRVARSFPISHIDNPVIRTRFDTDFELLTRYRRSAPNFARLVAWHPNALGKSPLVRAALLARHLPFRATFTRLAGELALSTSMPINLRAGAFKVWRALTYASAL